MVVTLKTDRRRASKPIRRRFFDGEGGDGGATGDTGSGGGGNDTVSGGGGGGDGDKTFTQADLDRILKARLTKVNEREREMVAKLEQLQKEVGDSEALRAEIDALKKRTFTQEELEREAREKVQKELEGHLTAARESSTQWESRYKTMLTKTQLQSAMLKHDVEPEMFDIAETFLTNLAKVESKDDVNSVLLTIQSTDKDGKPTELVLTPDEAVKHLKDSGKYRNLFKGGNNGGVGESGDRGNSGVDPLSLSMEAYSKLPPEQRYGN